MQIVQWRVTKVVLGVDRSSYVLSQNKATVMAGTCLYIGPFVSNFLFLFQLIGAINLLLICGKMKYYQCHICSSHSYNSNLPSGPLGPRQIGNLHCSRQQCVVVEWSGRSIAVRVRVRVRARARWWNFSLLFFSLCRSARKELCHGTVYIYDVLTVCE